MDSKTLALRCRELADDKKAENLLILDMQKLSSVADYFVLATGGSEPHLRAIVSEISEKLEEEGVSPGASDGVKQSNWVVLDYGDVIVHVMRADVRERYDLEGLWGDAPRLRVRAPKRASSDEPLSDTAIAAAAIASSPGPKPKPARRPRVSKVAATTTTTAVAASSTEASSEAAPKSKKSSATKPTPKPKPGVTSTPKSTSKPEPKAKAKVKAKVKAKAKSAAASEAQG